MITGVSVPAETTTFCVVVPAVPVGLVTVSVHRVGGRGLESIRDDAPGRVLLAAEAPGIRAVVTARHAVDRGGRRVERHDLQPLGRRRRRGERRSGRRRTDEPDRHRRVRRELSKLLPTGVATMDHRIDRRCCSAGATNVERRAAVRRRSRRRWPRAFRRWPAVSPRRDALARDGAALRIACGHGDGRRLRTAVARDNVRRGAPASATARTPTARSGTVAVSFSIEQPPQRRQERQRGRSHERTDESNDAVVHDASSSRLAEVAEGDRRCCRSRMTSLPAWSRPIERHVGDRRDAGRRCAAAPAAAPRAWPCAAPARSPRSPGPSRGTVKVTAESNGNGTSTPGALRPSVRR